jgi:hypothetical protein
MEYWECVTVGQITLLYNGGHGEYDLFNMITSFAENNHV